MFQNITEKRHTQTYTHIHTYRYGYIVITYFIIRNTIEIVCYIRYSILFE